MKDFLTKNYKLIIIVLLLTYTILASTSIINKSVTYDEITYVSSGYRIVKLHDYRLNTEHPPLAKILAGLPLLLINPNIPDYNEDQWTYAHKFFFESGNDADKMLFLARIPFILIGILLGIYVFYFSKELFGVKAGLLSLFLYSLCPNIIAYSQLAITDFLVIAFLFNSSYYLYKYLNNKDTGSYFLCALYYGLALTSKFTALYLLPFFFILPFYHEVKSLEMLKKKVFLKSMFHQLIKMAAILSMAFFILVLSYMFRLEFYIDGLLKMIGSSSYGRFSYLLGKNYVGNNFLYYPVAFLVKTPFPLIIFVSYLLFKKREKKDGYLLLPVLLFLVPTFLNRINLGLRHILIIYPFLQVYSGKIANIKFDKKAIIVLTLVWYLLSSFLNYPHYLSYFNEVSGGPDNGYKYLLDSNIDWGQDAKPLAQYIKKEGITNISIFYFGNDDFQYRGINYSNVNCVPVKGVAAISVNYLIGLKESDAACNKWLREESPYKKIGHTIWLYNITRNYTQQDIESNLKQYKEALARDTDRMLQYFIGQCNSMCESNCKKNKEIYWTSKMSEGKCICTCR